MKAIRRSNQRGHANHGWLDSYHTFSFADYFDPRHMGFGHLRVINEDDVAGGAGFGMHPHRDMEIVTYVTSGALEHRDNMGNQSVLRAGEVQRMTAGTGVMHSEFNHSKTEPVHLFQIWIIPEQEGLTPGYEQKAFDEAGEKNQLQLLVAREPRNGALKIHQEMEIYRAHLDAGVSVSIPAATRQWFQMIDGEMEIDSTVLYASDALSSDDQSPLTAVARSASKFLLFQMK